jgi:hypothetical protein
MSRLADAAAPATSLIRSKQVSPLPVGPGGQNAIKTQMNETNTTLTMLTAQAAANTKYDPPVPKPVTKAVIKETFTTNSIQAALFVVGGLLVVYGIVAK